MEVSAERSNNSVQNETVVRMLPGGARTSGITAMACRHATVRVTSLDPLTCADDQIAPTLVSRYPPVSPVVPIATLCPTFHRSQLTFCRTITQGGRTNRKQTQDSRPWSRDRRIRQARAPPLSIDTIVVRSDPSLPKMDALADEEEPAPTGSLREEESAEDILAQSLTFARTTRLPGRVRYPSVGSIERAGDSEELLPPAMATMEHCPVDASQEEEKTEIGEEEPYVMATASVAMATQEATVIGADDDDDLTTLKRQAYHGLADQSACHVSPHSPTQQATAFVIEDGDHASLTLDAVEAEFVRPDFNAPMPEPLPDDSPAVTGYSSLADEEETATEATVIDSAPLAGHHPDDEDLPAYKLHGEAQVLEDASSLASMDRKPAAIGDDDDEDDDDNGDFAVADQQAEVVGLQEEVHPMEFDDDTEAELIGTDYTVGVAVATGQPDHLDAEAEYTFVNEEAEVLDIRENMHPLEYGGTDATEAELLGTNFSVGVAVTPRASASVERGFATEATAELGSQVGQGYAIRVTVDSTAVAEGSVTVVDEESAPATLMHDDAIHATPVHTQGGPGEPSTPASAIPVAAAFTSRFDGEEGREISVEESIRSDPTDPVKPPPVVAAAAAAVLPEMDENAANPIGKTAASEGTLEEDPPDWLRDVAGSPPAPPPQPRPFGDAREKSETSGASEGSLRNLQMVCILCARAPMVRYSF